MNASAWLSGIVPSGIRRFRIHLLFGSLVFALCAYFYNGYGANQTARYDAIWNFVEPGPAQHTVRIDRFLSDPVQGLNTADWARNPSHSPHYYSNKAPGTMLLGIPFYWTLHRVQTALGLDATSVQTGLINAYLVHLWVTVLPVALSAIFFLHGVHRLVGRMTLALLIATVLYLGTLLLPFSTMLWGHPTAAAFVAVGLVFFIAPGEKSLFGSGLFVGLAVLTDYGAAPLACVLLVAVLISRRHRDRSGFFVLGALGPAVVFLVYHKVVFGSFLTLASSHSNPAVVTGQRMTGLFGPVSPEVVVRLLLSPSRGIFFYMPVLALSVVGAIRALRGSRRELAVVLGAAIVATLLLNASFSGWHGGVSAGPRYQISVLPAWALLLALLPEKSRWSRWLVVLGAVSIANAFVVAAVSPVAPDSYLHSPLLFCYRQLASLATGGLIEPLAAGVPGGGPLHIHPERLMRPWSVPTADPVRLAWTSFNLGERVLGLRGFASLLPAIGLLAGGLTGLGRMARKEDG